MIYDKKGNYNPRTIFRLINNCSDLKLLGIMFNKLRSRNKYQEAYIAASKIIRIDPKNLKITDRLSQMELNGHKAYDFSSWYC